MAFGTPTFNGGRGAGGSGGSFTPDGSLPQYTTMSALAAALTDVGRLALLVGATTGGRIALVERRAAGANGLVWHGDLALDQADGTELDGAFAPVSLGTTPAATWGGPSARGLILPAGTVKLPGWQYGVGRKLGLFARVEGWTTPSPPSQNHCIGAGFIRESGGIAYGGGTAYNATPSRRGALISGGTVELPTATVGSTLESGLVDGTPLDVGVDSAQVSAGGNGRYHSGYWGDGATTGGTSSIAVAFQANIVDWQPALLRRGNWGAARVTRVRFHREIGA